MISWNAQSWCGRKVHNYRSENGSLFLEKKNSHWEVAGQPARQRPEKRFFLVTGNLLPFFDRSPIRFVASRSKTISVGGVGVVVASPQCRSRPELFRLQHLLLWLACTVTGGISVCPSIWTHTTHSGTLTEGTLHRLNIFLPGGDTNESGQGRALCVLDKQVFKKSKY